MELDPYAECPCGSGKKIKWCRPKAIEQVVRAQMTGTTEAPQAALRILDRLAEEPDPPRCLAMFIEATQLIFDPNTKIDDWQALGEKYPDFGWPNQVLGDFFLSAKSPIQASKHLQQALKTFPAEAKKARAKALTHLGVAYLKLGKPLAAWAAWSQVLSLDPQNKLAADLLAEDIRGNQYLPNEVRQGLSLKSPDELRVFNEDRRAKWDRALAKSTNLDDLIAALEFLTEDDPDDQAAWYNLGLAHAWRGDTLAALDALDRYVRLEEDFNAAASAWEIAEVIRGASDAGAQGHQPWHVASYDVHDIQDLAMQLESSPYILVQVTGEETPPLIHVLDREKSSSAGIPILGGPNRKLAMLMIAPGMVQLHSLSHSSYQKAKARFEEIAGGRVTFRSEARVPRGIEMIDAEALWFLLPDGCSVEERREKFLELAELYFETEWLRAPLVSLGGLAPLDAAQGKEYRKRLEGVLRLRERAFAPGLGFNFRRVRHKLGLGVPGEDATFGVGIPAYSAADLAGIADPAALSDDDLLAAYRVANGLDAPEQALRFAREVVRRDALAAKIDPIPLFRRLVLDRIERQELGEAADLWQAAQDWDAAHGGQHAGLLADLSARLALARGANDEALALYRARIDQEPADLDFLASASETLLRAGQYAGALEFVETGLARLDEYRRKDLRDQLREYESVARDRLGRQ